MLAPWIKCPCALTKSSAKHDLSRLCCIYDTSLGLPRDLSCWDNPPMDSPAFMNIGVLFRVPHAFHILLSWLQISLRRFITHFITRAVFLRLEWVPCRESTYGWWALYHSWLICHSKHNLTERGFPPYCKDARELIHHNRVYILFVPPHAETWYFASLFTIGLEFAPYDGKSCSWLFYWGASKSSRRKITVSSMPTHC